MRSINQAIIATQAIRANCCSNKWRRRSSRMVIGEPSSLTVSTLNMHLPKADMARGSAHRGLNPSEVGEKSSPKVPRVMANSSPHGAGTHPLRSALLPSFAYRTDEVWRAARSRRAGKSRLMHSHARRGAGGSRVRCAWGRDGRIRINGATESIGAGRRYFRHHLSLTLNYQAPPHAR